MKIIKNKLVAEKEQQIAKPKAIESQPQAIESQTPKQDEQLEQVVEEAIKELDDEIIPYEVEKEFDELAENKKSECQELEQATNNEIINECLKNRSKSQDLKNDIHTLKTKEAEHFIEVMKELHFIKKHMNKVAVITMGVVFAGGYIFGTQHEHISPYIGKIWEFMSLFKGSGGQ